MKLILHLDFLTPGLNGSEGLIRQHFMAAKRLKTKLHLILLQQRPPGHKLIDKPVKVTYVRYTSSLMDWDNCCASFKHVGDALQDAGIIKDDSPTIIAQFIPLQIKCTRSEQRTEIHIDSI